MILRLVCPLVAAMLVAALLVARFGNGVSAESVAHASTTSGGICALRIVDVTPAPAGGVIFVIGGELTGGSADVEFVTARTLYGLTIPNVAASTAAPSGADALSVPYSTSIPEDSALKGVYVSNYTDASGSKYACDPLDGMPLDALPYLTSLPHDSAVRASMRALHVTNVALPPALAIADYSQNPVCDVPYRKANVKKGVEPRFPANLPVNFGSWLAIVSVSVDSEGTVMDTFVKQSTGFPAFDASAVEAARASSYVPAIVTCKREPSTVLFRASFSFQ